MLGVLQGWQQIIGRPQGATYEPLHNRQVESYGDCELYFRLRTKQIPLDGKLRLRLVVTRNEDLKQFTPAAPKPGDPDAPYVQPGPSVNPDPLITGSINVT